MSIFGINTNSTIKSIIEGEADGVIKNYLVLPSPKKELDQLVKIASKLHHNGISPYIKVKYDWEYGQRARVLDIVGCSGEVIHILKKTSINMFDKHAYDLERIKNSLMNTFSLPNHNIKTALVFIDNSNREEIDSKMKKLDINIEHFII